jgi:hypothetical protein
MTDNFEENKVLAKDYIEKYGLKMQKLSMSA